MAVYRIWTGNVSTISVQFRTYPLPNGTAEVVVAKRAGGVILWRTESKAVAALAVVRNVPPDADAVLGVLRANLRKGEWSHLARLLRRVPWWGD